MLFAHFSDVCDAPQEKANENCELSCKKLHEDYIGGKCFSKEECACLGKLYTKVVNNNIKSLLSIVGGVCK